MTLAPNWTPHHDGDGAAAIHAVLWQVLLSKAAALARQGQYAAAGSILKDMVSGGSGIAPALDLMARIRAQQGRLSDAAQLWARAVDMDPGNESYRAGLRRIEIIQRRPLWVGMVLPFGAALVAAVAIWVVGLMTRSQLAGLQEAFLTDAAALVRTVQQNKAPPPATSEADLTWAGTLSQRLADSVPGIRVKTEQHEVVVHFNEGLFLFGTTLKPEAKRTLSRLAQQLESADQIAVRVIGCTDNTPVPAGAIFSDNVALGMGRAVTVMDHLRTKEGLPVRIFSVQSAGGAVAPYANDSRDNMLRNRTVIIRISPIENRA